MAGKTQAKHNEDLCELLLKNGKFSDWVITSAFYSALHYVEHEIFPLIDGTKSYSNFEEYYSLKHTSGNPNKHNVRKQLVAKHIPNCSADYNWLHDNCFNARYNDYNVSPTFAKVAKEKLDSLKSKCKK